MRTKARCLAAVSSGIPVVSISSPPESHGVGSCSSEMWTQRTGAPAPVAPAARPRSSSSSRLWTVSTILLGDYLVPGLAENLPQHLVDLFELRRVGDQRRRQLDHRVAAVVGAADQPVAVELAGDEAAQQPLRLVVVEGLLRIPVLDQLDRLEEAGAAHVADDRQVAQALQHLPELALLRQHVAAEVLALVDVEVGHRD